MADDVKVELTPSADLVNNARALVTVTDAKGRAIVLRKPGVLAQYRLVETLGASASNEVYMSMVLPLIYIESIDGDVVSTAKRLQIDALIQRLDEEGIKAVMEGVQANFGAPDPEADKAALKN